MSSNINEIRKKITKTYEIISCGYHEAGHAIYALLHLIRVSSVLVFENKKIKRIHGFTYYNCPIEFESIKDSNLLNYFVRSDVGMCYAGLVAEKHLFSNISGSRHIPMFISGGSTDDNKDAREIIKKYNLAASGQKKTTFKIKLINEVQKELYRHWDSLTLVAHALFRHRKLTYQDLRQLLTKKSTNKKFWKKQFKILNFLFNNKNLDEKALKAVIN